MKAVQLLRAYRGAEAAAQACPEEERPIAQDDGEGGGSEWTWTRSHNGGKAASQPPSTWQPASARSMDPVAKQAIRAWLPGDRIQVDAEDGWENATVVGPSLNGDPLQLHIRFADGVEDDWDVADFRRAAIQAVDASPPVRAEASREQLRRLQCCTLQLIAVVAAVTIVAVIFYALL